MLENRQSGTIWDQVCNWVNSQGTGNTFKTRNYLYELQDVPVVPCRIEYGPDYRLHQYKGYLGRLGFLKNTSYGVWEVVKEIPGWFNLGHVQFLFNYKESEKYNGMTREEIVNNF